jgi:hypothetical protein
MPYRTSLLSESFACDVLNIYIAQILQLCKIRPDTGQPVRHINHKKKEPAMSDPNDKIVNITNAPIARGYTTPEGSRVTLRFDAPTWEAIDYLAKRRGFKNWAGWVHRAVPHRFENNRHADIRAAVSESLMQQVRPLEFAAGDPVLSINALLLMEAFTLDDAGFIADLSRGAPDVFLDGIVPLDFGGFTLRTGMRDGRHCFWIQNSMRKGRHLVVPVPAWVKQMADLNEDTKAQLKDQAGPDTDNT